MGTHELAGITGDISVLVNELSRFGCSIEIIEWVDGGSAARLQAHLPADRELAEKCRRLIEERKGPVVGP
jgi:hypothetical protein